VEQEVSSNDCSILLGLFQTLVWHVSRCHRENGEKLKFLDIGLIVFRFERWWLDESILGELESENGDSFVDKAVW
jgi:hypothetical protein